MSRRRQLRLTKISHCAAWLASWLMTHLAGLVAVQCLSVDRLAVLRLQEVVGKAEYLKTIPIADDPQIELMPFPVGGLDLDEARQAGLLGNGLIPVR